MESKPYWTLPCDRKIPFTFDEAVEKADYLLKEAVRIRLQADVPVGCFLSGGIDSGLLTAIASMQMNRPLKTFTVSFEDNSYDESINAGIVAKRYNTDHRTVNLSANLEKIIIDEQQPKGHKE